MGARTGKGSVEVRGLRCADARFFVGILREDLSELQAVRARVQAAKAKAGEGDEGGAAEVESAGMEILQMILSRRSDTVFEFLASMAQMSVEDLDAEPISTLPAIADAILADKEIPDFLAFCRSCYQRAATLDLSGE